MSPKESGVDQNEFSNSSHRPSIYPSDKLLSSFISLPDKPCIAYSVFTSPGNDSLYYQDSLELARRKITLSNKTLPLLQSCLPSVHIRQEPVLYVFSITSHDRVAQTLSALKELHFDGIIATETSSFALDDIYPAACSGNKEHCPTCSDSTHLHPASQPSSSTSSQSVDHSLPRQALRHALSHFREAIRDRLIDDISESYKTNPSVRSVMRFKGGFLLGQRPASSEWAVGWQHRALTRPLIYCHLEIGLTPSRIVIHPVLRSTHLLPLHSLLPQFPGLPIMLAPHATPAYVISAYAGPTSALTSQFDESLAGLGIGEWKTLPDDFTMYKSGPKERATSTSPSFIVAWINVENKHGEEKGVAVIWPVRLCLSFLPSSHTRPPLSNMPVLPRQLQSPLLLPSTFTRTSPLDHDVIYPPEGVSVSRQGFRPFTGDSTHAFHVHTSWKAIDINKVATEVGAYVDAIAREREKERERIRRERENANLLHSPHAVMTATNATKCATPATPARVTQSDSSAGHIVNSLAQTPLPSALNLPMVMIPAQQHPSQLFYPSPPQSNLVPAAHVDDMQTSPVIDAIPMADIPDTTSPQFTSASTIDLTQSSSTSFDPFGNFESSWSQRPTDEFMDLSIDFGMGLSMDMDPITGGGSGGSVAYDRGGLDFEDVFTDDDFSFFDRPSKIAPAPVNVPLGHVNVASVLTASAPLSHFPPLLEDGIDLSRGPPAPAPCQQQQPSWGGPLVDPLSSKFGEGESVHSEMLFGQTPRSQSAPTSPCVHLSREFDNFEQKSITSYGPSVFDPILFDSYHQVADGKYVVGKFALPSPPDEEDRLEIPKVHPPPPPSHGWWLRYKAATDPRVGVVRKLLDVKNVPKHLEPNSRETKTAMTWARECEDWANDVTDTDKSKPDAESDEEDLEDNISSVISRPATPAPAFIALGSTLLQTRFQHGELLALSMPLRPEAAIAPANIMSPPAPTSVPTPVSPGAMLGAASEKSRSLEATASTIAREMAENSVWATAWRANTARSEPPKSVSEIWQADVRAVDDLLKSIPALEGSLNLDSLFQFDSRSTMSGGITEEQLHPLEPPMISVGKAGATVQVLSPALRFWEKLALRPRGGQKDVAAFVFFEEEDQERQQQVENWLERISAAYSGKKLGQHIAGTCSICPKDGLVPLRFDAFRKHLFTFLRNLPSFQASLVFYILVPANAMTLASPTLRQIFSAVKRALKTYPEARILHQFVPVHITVGSAQNPARHVADLETICFSVYNRIPQTIVRLTSRRFLEHGESNQCYFPEPAFALARPVHHRVGLLWQAPTRSLDVMDRHTLLHVGYQITPCGKWIVAACIDQRGEAHDIGVWLSQSESHESHLVKQVWEFAVHFARKASVEWRLAIAKLGPMNGSELEAWMMHLGAAIPSCRELSSLHVSILSIEPDVPWAFIAPTEHHNGSAPPSSSDGSRSLFVDGSASTYALWRTTPFPLSPVLPYSRRSETGSSFVSDIDVSCCESVNVLPLSTTTLVRVPNEIEHTTISMLHIHLLRTLKSSNSSLTISDKEIHIDITRNYHELAVLARCRWSLNENALLPFHLAAVDAAHLVLDSALD